MAAGWIPGDAINKALFVFLAAHSRPSLFVVKIYRHVKVCFWKIYIETGYNKGDVASGHCLGRRTIREASRHAPFQGVQEGTQERSSIYA